MFKNFQSSFVKRAMDVKLLVLTQLLESTTKGKERRSLIIKQFKETGIQTGGGKISSKCEVSKYTLTETSVKSKPKLKQRKCGRIQFGTHCQECKHLLNFLPEPKWHRMSQSNAQRPNPPIRWSYSSCKDWKTNDNTPAKRKWKDIDDLSVNEVCALLTAFKLSVVPAVSLECCCVDRRVIFCIIQ